MRRIGNDPGVSDHFQTTHDQMIDGKWTTKSPRNSSRAIVVVLGWSKLEDRNSIEKLGNLYAYPMFNLETLVFHLKRAQCLPNLIGGNTHSK
jgi:hypothetical protein